MPTVTAITVEEKFNVDNVYAWRHTIRWEITGFGKLAGVGNWQITDGPWKTRTLPNVSGWLFQHVVTEVAPGQAYSQWQRVAQDPDYWEMWVVVRRGGFRQRRRLVLPSTECKNVEGFQNYDAPPSGYNDSYDVSHVVLDHWWRMNDFHYRKTGTVYFVEYSADKGRRVNMWLAGTGDKGPWGILPAQARGPDVLGASSLVRTEAIRVQWKQKMGPHEIEAVR